MKEFVWYVYLQREAGPLEDSMLRFGDIRCISRPHGNMLDYSNSLSWQSDYQIIEANRMTELGLESQIENCFTNYLYHYLRNQMTACKPQYKT